MAVPVVFLGFLGLSFAILWFITKYDNPMSTGESVTIDFSSACLEDSLPFLSERARQVGMPVQLDQGSMTTTLPSIPNAREHVPALLTTPGRLIVTSDGFSASNEQFEDIAIDLDKAGMPETLIKFDADTRAAIKTLDDEAELQPTLDGVDLATVRASLVKEEGILALHSGDGKTADRMQRAADRAIVLAHGPLPCVVKTSGVRSTEKNKQ